MKRPRFKKGKLIGLNGKPLVDEREKPAQKRPHLADMMELPKKYKLLPESYPMGEEGMERPMRFEPVDPTDDPSKDNIIEIIGKAYPEMVSFVREIDELKANYAGACSTVAEMHKAAMGKVIGPVRGIVEDVEDLRLRYFKALDVLKGIAFSSDHASAEQIRFRAKKFIEDNDRLSSLVDEKGGGPN